METDPENNEKGGLSSHCGSSRFPSSYGPEVKSALTSFGETPSNEGK